MMDALKVVKNTVRAMEWCGSSQGPGSGTMGSGGDGQVYASCPACHGLRDRNGDFSEKHVGHRPECPVAYLLGFERRS